MASGAQLARAVGAHVCLHAAMSGARMAVPLFVLQQGFGSGAAGMLVALFSLAPIFLCLPAGRYADRHGLRRPAVFSIVAITSGAGAAALWPVFPALCLTGLLCGGGAAAAIITLQRHVGRMAAPTGQLRQAFGWLSFGTAAANFLGPFAAGLLIDRAGYQAVFAALALLPLLASALLHGVHEIPAEAAEGGPKGSAWALLRDAPLRRLIAMNLFMNATSDLHGFMVPLLGHDRGLAASTIGGILGAFAIASAVVRVLIPLFAQRVREKVLITAATALAGAMLLAYPFTGSTLAMVVCSVVIGACVGMVQPMVMSLLHQVAPAHRHGEVLAVRLILVYMCGAGLPLLLGALGGAVGLGGVFWLMGAVVGAGSSLGRGLKE